MSKENIDVVGDLLFLVQLALKTCSWASGVDQGLYERTVEKVRPSLLDLVNYIFALPALESLAIMKS